MLNSLVHIKCNYKRPLAKDGEKGPPSLGLALAKEKIAVAMADEGREVPSYWGVILNTPDKTWYTDFKESDWG